jgi:translation initiation factor 6
LTILRHDLAGSPYVGVYCAASGDHLFVPVTVDGAVMDELGSALGLTARKLSIGGSGILGSLMVLNSKGALVPSFIDNGDLETLRKDLEVGLVEGRMNACGNNILASEKAAMVNPRLPPGAKEVLADVLGVEVVPGTIAGMGIVGAAAVVTEKGILCHPKTTDDERQALEDLFGLESRIGTANYGAPLLGACMVANSRGCVVGTPTTGIELGRIEEALDLYSTPG